MTDLVYAAEQVQQLLRCAICLDRFRHPKLLPCQHTFCESPCLEGLIDRYTRRVKCPECRLEHRVPMSGTAGFPNNLTIISFLELPQQTSGNGIMSTITPENSNSEHQPPPPTSHHQDNVTTPQIEKNPPSANAMCSDCGRITSLATCSHCSEEVCERCRHLHISGLKQEILRQLQRIRRTIPNVTESLSSVEHRRDHIQRMCNSVKNTIADTIDKYVRDLKLRHDYLNSEINEFLLAEIRALQDYQENLELELTSIASFCDSTEPLLTQRGDLETNNINLQDIKRQGQEHISTLQNHTTIDLPTARQLTFQADGGQLAPAIGHFGELMVMLQTNPSSYIRNTMLGYADVRGGTNLRDYNDLREPSRTTTAAATATSTTRPIPSGADTVRRSDPIAIASSSNPPGNRSMAVTPQILSTSQYAADTPSTSKNSNPRHSSTAAAASNGVPTSSTASNSQYMPSNTTSGQLARREASGLPSNFLEKDVKYPEEHLRYNSGAAPSNALPGGSADSSTHYGRREDALGEASDGSRMEYSSSRRPMNRSLFSDDVPSSPQTYPRGYRHEMLPYMESPYHSSSRAPPARNELVLYQDDSSLTPFERRSLPNSPVMVRRDRELEPDEIIFPAALTWHPRSENSPRFSGYSRGQNPYYNQSTLPISSNWRDLYGWPEQPAAIPQTSKTALVRHRPETLAYAPHIEMEESSPSPDSPHDIRLPIVQLRYDPRALEAESSDDENMDETTAPGYRHCKLPSTIVTQARNNYQAKHRSWTRFGEHGNEEAQFISPRGVAASQDDEIYVCDSSNHRVEIFDNTGIFLQSFGSYGKNNGEFDCVADIAVNNFGSIAITDRYNNRIQIFDRHGRFQTSFGCAGQNDGELNYPWGIAWDSMGFLYTCDKENHRIQVFQSNGNFVRKFGAHGHGRVGLFDGPYYIAVSPDNHIYVSDSNNHRIQVFTIYGDFLFAFGSEGSNRGQMRYPKGIAIDEQGFVVVADSANNRIQVFRGDGRYYSMFGSRGDQASHFNGPEGVTVMNNGCVVITDRENHRVQLF